MSKQMLSAKGAPLEPIWGVVGLGINDAKLLTEQEGETFVAEMQRRLADIEKLRLNLGEWLELLSLVETFMRSDTGAAP